VGERMRKRKWRSKKVQGNTITYIHKYLSGPSFGQPRPRRGCPPSAFPCAACRTARGSRTCPLRVCSTQPPFTDPKVAKLEHLRVPYGDVCKLSRTGRV
jgi:hypothetical protein